MRVVAVLVCGLLLLPLPYTNLNTLCTVGRIVDSTNERITHSVRLSKRRRLFWSLYRCSHLEIVSYHSTVSAPIRCSHSALSALLLSLLSSVPD